MAFKNSLDQRPANIFNFFKLPLEKQRFLLILSFTY
jgi:hypothetical protein